MKGFSLIELVLVIAVFGILVAMTGPNLSGFIAREAIHLQSSRVQEALNRARQIARSKNACVEVNIASRRVTLTSFRANQDCSGTRQNVLEELVVRFPEAVQLNGFSTGNPLIVNSRGGTLHNTVSTLSLREGGRTASVKIYPAAGQVRVQ